MGLTVYTVLSIAVGVILVIRSIRGYVVKVKKLKEQKAGIFLEAIEPFLKKSFRVLLVTLVVVFIGGAIVPYMLNQADAAYVRFSNANIELYNEYIDEYTKAARKQIEEYQELQSEMAKSATSTQLQFWSEQQDEVGNTLTDKIQEYKNDIMNEEIEINKREARIEQRSLNKWFFWHRVE